MAGIIGCVTTSHVPAIGGAIAKGRPEEPCWKEWFDGFKPVLGAGSGGEDVGIREVAATYHVPISNTAAGMMLLEPAG